MRSYFWMLVQNISGVQRCALFLARIYQGCCRECNLDYTILWSSWTWFNHENKSLTLNTWAQQQLLSKKKKKRRKEDCCLFHTDSSHMWIKCFYPTTCCRYDCISLEDLLEDVKSHTLNLVLTTNEKSCSDSETWF